MGNAFDGDSVSIHVYGGDLAALAPLRGRWDAATGDVMPFRGAVPLRLFGSSGGVWGR